MKKTIAILLTFVLVFFLLAGCGNAGQTPKAVEASKGIQPVYNVDELISAIAPGAQIQLAEGEFNLANANSYGRRTGNPYVKWVELYDNEYALLIHDVDNLSISGSGKDSTRIIAKCPEADVLKFEDCVSVHLSDFTAGHTPQSEGCSVGVIYLFRSLDVSLDRLGLFGCGSVGINADRTDCLTVTECEVYDCSHSGLNLSRCNSVTISHSVFRNIGKMLDGFSAGYTVFGINMCDTVQIDSCAVENNVTEFVLSAWETKLLQLSENRFTGNAAAQGMFMLFDSDTTLDSSNVFDGNSFSRWYAKPWDGSTIQYAVNERGEEIILEDPEPVHSTSAPMTDIPVVSGEQKQVEAATVDEFLAAIASNTAIILTQPMYDLSTASDYGKTGTSDYYAWEEEFDGWELVITGVDNFSIIGADGKENHTISAVPRYADVISFDHCSNVLVKDFTAGHTTEPGYCSGGVLNYQNCSYAVVDSCNLYGCGILGVLTCEVKDFYLVNSCIYECSQGGIYCTATDNLMIGGCTFWDLGGDTFQLSGCKNVSIDGKAVNGNYYGN